MEEGWEMWAVVEVLGMVGREGFAKKAGPCEEKGRERAVWVSGEQHLCRGNSRGSHPRGVPGLFRNNKEASALEHSRRSVRRRRALGLSRPALGSRDFEQRGGVISPPSSSLSCCHVETRAKGAAEDSELLFRGCCSK